MLSTSKVSEQVVQGTLLPPRGRTCYLLMLFFAVHVPALVTPCAAYSLATYSNGYTLRPP
eukprot:2723988-Prymnesium_polylepis.1